MIVPRDYAGQRLLWEQLNQVFGGNGTCPPCPDPPEPEPCVQDFKRKVWTNIVKFREDWGGFVFQGDFWDLPGMRKESWYMLIERQVKAIQISRIINYNKKTATVTLPGIDGWLMLNRVDVPFFKGVSEPGTAVSFDGQPAWYFLTLIWSEAYLTLEYHLISQAVPPAFDPVEGSLIYPSAEVDSVYLSLWNWGYNEYTPEMDREVRITMFMSGDYGPDRLERPKVLHVEAPSNGS